VPLSPALTERLLARRRDSYRGPKAPVFASTVGTELLPANVYRRVLAPAAIGLGLKVEYESEDKAGNPETKIRSAVSFHTFRHTCASLLFAKDRNIKQVQEWLGHADPGFTLRTYVHLLDGGVGEGLEIDLQVKARSRRGTETDENKTLGRPRETA